MIMRPRGIKKYVLLERAVLIEKLKMKIRILFVAACVAGMATMNVTAAGLLSPKAADNQSQTVRGYNPDPSLTDIGLQSAPPRVVESRSKTVPGKSLGVTPSLTCVRHMHGSPKMIGDCASRATATMSCCTSCCAPGSAK